MANYCELCRQKFGAWNGLPLVSSKDNKSICYHCGKSIGRLSDDMIDFCRKEGYLSICSRMTYEESLSYIQELPNKIKNDTSLAKYNFSYAPCKEIKFDDSNKVFIIPRNDIAKKENYNAWDYVLLKYSQIVSFDLIENGSSIASGGLGRAVVGGLLFGGAGAIVGAVTRSYNELCTELSIKITVKDYSAPAVYVPLVSSGGIMKNTTLYNEYIKTAQDILSKLQIITNNVDSSTTVNTTDLPNEPIHASSSPAFSAADEILKFKKLMDEGIITQEEFDAKKKQLLGIEPAVINSAVINPAVVNSSETKNSEYYSVIISSYNDCKMAVTGTYLQYKQCAFSEARQIIDSADLPFEIIGTTSKTEAEEVAKKFSATGAAVEIRQPKSDGGYDVKKFKNGYAIDDKLPKIEAIDLEAKWKDPEVGDEIYFGINNGKRMRWKVLGKQDCRIQVITTDIVCKKPYHQNEKDITWSECTLRKWLNSDFIDGYFTQEERDRIVPWELNNDDNPEYKTPGGVHTTDKVFLLSIDEAKSLFADDQERSLDFWWLRSSGVCPTNAATVTRVGTVHTHGHGITSTSIGVRPALWLDLTSTKWGEEAQKRIDDYWEAHSDERKKLESEQKDLEEQIATLYASQTEQVAALNNEIAAIPGKAEIDKLDERIVKLNNEKNSLGIFKGKEKNALQEQIDQAFADKKAVQDRMDAAKTEIEKRISAFNSDIQKKISPLQSRIDSIYAELNKER